MLSGNELADLATRHGIKLTASRAARLAQYCKLLWQWNDRINLTRHLDYQTFVTRDLVDSIQLATFLDSGERVLDVGSGGGVPGVVLAILRPDVRWSLCESTTKKARVLEDITRQLQLDIPIYPDRVEKVLAAQSFEAIVARAVGPMWKILSWLQPHWGHFGRLLLIKGPGWVDERAAARHKGLLKPIDLRRLATYHTPGRASENVILGLWPKSTE